MDCAIEIAAEFPQLRADEVEDVHIEASLYTEYLGRVADGYVTGPDTPTSALPLSIPYTVATALLTGGLVVSDFSAPAVDEAERWELAARVHLTQDEGMTRDLLTSEAPFGEAIRQAGERAKAWVHGFGGDRAVELLGTLEPPRKDFLDATKHTGARVTVRLTDGRVVTRRRTSRSARSDRIRGHGTVSWCGRSTWRSADRLRWLTVSRGCARRRRDGWLNCWSGSWGRARRRAGVSNTSNSDNGRINRLFQTHILREAGREGCGLPSRVCR